MHDPLLDAIERAAEYGAGTDEVWHIPDDSVIRPGTGENLWDGLSITFWTGD